MFLCGWIAYFLRFYIWSDVFLQVKYVELPVLCVHWALQTQLLCLRPKRKLQQPHTASACVKKCSNTLEKHKIIIKKKKTVERKERGQQNIYWSRGQFLWSNKKQAECESCTSGNMAWCNGSWLQSFQSDGNTGEMDSHMEALLITAGVCVFPPVLLLCFITDAPNIPIRLKGTKV